MITIKFEATPETLSDVRKLAKFFASLDLTPEITTQVEHTVRSGFMQNFEKEGPPGQPWAPLSAYTQKRRKSLGYSGPHPILERSGGLKYSFAPGSPTGFREVLKAGGVTSIALGSNHPLADLLEGGMEEVNLPARPISVLGEGQASSIGDILDEFFSREF